MVDVSIEADIENAELLLRELKAHIPDISKKILKKIASKGKAKLRRAYKLSGLGTNSGRLYRAIYGSAKNNAIGYFGLLSKQRYKFVSLNYGATIRPKREKYLRFQNPNTGDWVRVSSVRIPAHDILSAGIAYANSEELTKDIFSVIDKEIDKLTRLV